MEQGITERRGARRPALPDPQRLGAEDPDPDVVELQVALESRLRGKCRRVHRLERRQVRLVELDVREDALPRRIGQAIVPGVDPEVCGPRRLLLDDTPEARLDEVVEAVVKRTGLRRRRRARQLHPAEAAIRHLVGGLGNRARIRAR